MSLGNHCADPWCVICVEALLYTGLLAPRDGAAPGAGDSPSVDR